MSLERFSQAISTWEVQSEVRGNFLNQTRQRVPEALWRIIIFYYYLNALRAYTATVPMTQYDVPEVSRRFRPHLPLHFAIKIAEK